MDILIRTSERPQYFKRCVGSIKGDHKLIVSVDTDSTERYALEILKAKGLPFEIVRQQKGTTGNYWNLYLNKLLEKAKGWIWILDDDNEVVDMDFDLEDKDKIYVYKIDYMGRELPEPDYWKTITESHIDMANFVFHKDGLKTEFDGERRADYRFLKEMARYREIEWVDKIIVKTDNKGWGKMNDLPIKIDFVVPYAYDKNLGAEYNRIMERSDAEYVCIMDGDLLFFQNDFGHFISDVIRKTPGGAIYTCLTNRIGNKEQRVKDMLDSNRHIIKHEKLASQLRKKHGHSVAKATMRTSMLMSVISKKVWEELKFKDGLEGIDWDFSQRVLDKGYPIYIMQGLYIFHLYRLGHGGIHYTKHLK